MRVLAISALSSIAFAVMSGNTRSSLPLQATRRINTRPASPHRAPLEKVWIVEQHEAYSIYSNGLQIRADYQTSSRARNYRTYARDTLVASEPKQTPAGIVYHTTESLLWPLVEERNLSLVRTREDLLSHVRREQLYNFVIDRFGQVFRIVPEDQVAFHAGHSVWADATAVYDGLNESFIGISFEAQTRTNFEATPAQVRSGRLLTDVLRAEYSISEADCVTHAQVSVNPNNMGIGYHTDWAAHFPFDALGLSEGYAIPVASVAVFGFKYDQTFLDAIGGEPWDGLASAEAEIDREAQKRQVTSAEYRKTLQERYRLIRKH